MTYNKQDFKPSPQSTFLVNTSIQKPRGRFEFHFTMKDAKKLKTVFVRPDEVRAAVLACMDFLETQLPKGIVIAGSTTFLLNGGISFKIEEKIKVEEYQDLNCREIVLAVLGHIYLWKKRDVGMGALVPDILDSFLKDSLSYVEMRNLFSDRVKLPSVEYLMDLSMKLDHSTKDMKEWVNEHKKAQTSAEIKIELPASLCDEHRRRLQN